LIGEHAISRNLEGRFSIGVTTELHGNVLSGLPHTAHHCWPDALKARIVAEMLADGTTASDVAQSYFRTDHLSVLRRLTPRPSPEVQGGRRFHSGTG